LSFDALVIGFFLASSWAILKKLRAHPAFPGNRARAQIAALNVKVKFLSDILEQERHEHESDIKMLNDRIRKEHQARARSRRKHSKP
jgi:hypothetical protein